MKKMGYMLLVIMVVVIGYGIIEEMVYSPLKKEDMKTLFPDSNISYNFAYSKDYIGWSKGNLFDIYVYELENVFINLDYPKFGKKWEHISLPDTVVTSKWVKCPIDSVILSNYNFELLKIWDSGLEGENLKRSLQDTNNYYCYIYVSALEKYFLLYNVSEKKLYYIRQRGF